ncbi:MAG: DUF4411 domain-containing protein [Planctomyces sp.]|nr:DUF4411 domain-containing protein [Planctomyces sp.]
MADKFLLDTNVFIQAKNHYFAFDICPGFWDSLTEQNLAKKVFSIDRVRQELQVGDDEITKWLRNKSLKNLFKKTEDIAVIREFQRMATWVDKQTQFRPEAKTDFQNAADGFVVAYASVNKMIVVTHETFAPNARKTVPIPNLCEQFEVKHLGTFEMLRQLGEKFERSSKRKMKRTLFDDA